MATFRDLLAAVTLRPLLEPSAVERPAEDTSRITDKLEYRIAYRLRLRSNQT